MIQSGSTIDTVHEPFCVAADAVVLPAGSIETARNMLVIIDFMLMTDTP
jgi:hypothetical protein